MYKKTIIVLLLLLAAWPLAAQRALTPRGEEPADTTDVAFHMSVGSTAAAGFGRSQLLLWAAPRVEWRASERLAVRGGLAMAGSLLPQGYELHGLGPRSLAPRRQGTRVGAAWAEADYRVGDHLWLWASVAHISGYAQPLWLDGAIPIAATAISGGVAYEFADNSLLEVHFHFVHDHYGSLLRPPYGGLYYGPLVPEWELYSGRWPF